MSCSGHFQDMMRRPSGHRLYFSSATMMVVKNHRHHLVAVRDWADWYAHCNTSRITV